MLANFAAALAAATLLPGVAAQTFQRLGACPDLGCVLPPDQSEFLPGQFFDLRVEVYQADRVQLARWSCWTVCL